MVVESQAASCYACKIIVNKYDFVFSNWKKMEWLMKHHKSSDHRIAMAKWQHNTSIAKQLDTAHKEAVKWNRDYRHVIIKCLAFTAQENIAHLYSLLCTPAQLSTARCPVLSRVPKKCYGNHSKSVQYHWCKCKMGSQL